MAQSAAAGGPEGAPGAAPREAEMRAMLAQMREAPAEEILADVANMLLQAAQVKLGRADARVLIDGVAALAEAVGERARGGLAGQVAQAVTQLRLAQVEAERELGTATEGAGDTDGATDAGPGAAPNTGGAAPSAPTPPPPAAPPSAASRLWVPGR